jgi:hypothetical protein
MAVIERPTSEKYEAKEVVFLEKSKENYSAG